MAGTTARVLLGYLAAALLIAGPHLRPVVEVSTATYDFLDAHISLWSLWWTHHALGAAANPFWTDHVFFPQGTSLAFHSYPFVYGLLSIPIQLAVEGKAGLALAFNALLLGSFVASAFGAYLLALHVTRSRCGALVAGLIYAFAPYHVLNSCRLAVAAIEVLPFYVLALLRLQERPSWPRAFALSAWLAVAYYNSVEYALYLILFSALWLARALLARELDRRLLLRLLGAGAAFALVAAPLLIQQLRVASGEASSVGDKLGEAVRWSPALLSFVTPSRAHPLLGPLWAFAGEFRDGVTLGMRSETAVAWSAWLLAGTAVLRRPRDGRAFFALVAACFFVLCLGPYLRISGTWATSIPLPYAALYEVFPPLRAIKEPTRTFPLLLLMLAILAAYGLRDLLAARGTQTGRARLITALAALLVMFEALTAWPWQSTPHMSVAVETPFYRVLARDARPFSIMDLSDPDATVLAQPVHGKKTIEWQGFIPRAAAAFADAPQFELGRVLQEPRRLVQLPGDAQRARVVSYRRALRAAATRYILLPAQLPQGQRSFLEEMARALGGSLRQERELLVIDLSALLASRGAP
jgi:hypothetical protein